MSLTFTLDLHDVRLAFRAIPMEGAGNELGQQHAQASYPFNICNMMVGFWCSKCAATSRREQVLRKGTAPSLPSALTLTECMATAIVQEAP